jgi:hypothetical protein
MMMRELQRVDFAIYLRALEVYFKNPIIALAPLAAGLLNILLLRFSAFGGGLVGLLTLLIELFALGVALIAADFAWRYKNARFGQAWYEAKRKVSDILLASLGVAFVIYLPEFLSGFLGPFVMILQAIAFMFIIYAIPAAAMGGVPGGAALQASVDRMQANPGSTLVLFIVCYAAYNAAPLIDSSIYGLLSPYITARNAVPVASVISACTHALALGYIASALAKVYYSTPGGRRL